MQGKLPSAQRDASGRTLFDVSVTSDTVHNRGDRTPSRLIAPEGAPHQVETVFIVGNGAIVGCHGLPVGWSVVEELKGGPLFFRSDCPERDAHYHSLNSEVILAHAAMNRRVCIHAALSEIMNDTVSGIDFLERLRLLHAFRERLGSGFRTACDQGLMELGRLPDRFARLLHQRDTGVVTLNWDAVIWDDARIVNKIQLHGACEDPATLILPTESVNEELGPHNTVAYLKRCIDLGFPVPQRALLDALHDFYHGTRGRVLNDLIEAHQLAMDWIQGARLVVFWGVALNSYDSEISSVFFEASGDGLQAAPEKEIVVVNPCREALLRTAGLLRRNPTEIHHVSDP